MRILSMTYEYPPIGGGGGAVAAALNEQLVAEGHAVDVVTSAMKGLRRAERVKGVRVHRTRCWRRHRHFTTVTELATSLLPAYSVACRVIERRQPDVIHAHFALPTGLIARSLSRKYGIPYALTAHGSDIPGYNPDRFELLHKLLAPAWRAVIRDAAAVVSPSQFLADLIHRSIDVPVHVVPNGYDADVQLGREKRNLVLVVARLFPRKGVQHFIDSVAALGQGWELVVAGDGPFMATLQQRASQVNAQVRFAGFLGKRELRALYEEARILVFPSIRENFPLVLLEGMDAGCAIITTDAEGCAEVVGDAGVVIGKARSEPLRDALLELMNDPEQCRLLGARAAERVQQFRWPQIAARYRAVLEGATRRQSSRAMRLGPAAGAQRP